MFSNGLQWLNTGLLLVNLGFRISRSLIHETCVLKMFLGNMSVRYRGINNKGVVDRPWTIWKVLRAISSTLKSNLPSNVEKWTF